LRALVRGRAFSVYRKEIEMRVLAIILLLAGLVFAGLGVMFYVKHNDLKERALSHLAKSRRLAEQAVAKEGTTEGERLAEESATSYQDYRSVMGSAQQPKGYATMNWMISGAAVLLSVTLFVIVSRRRREPFASTANSAAY
jgi:hypothetical protein